MGIVGYDVVVWGERLVLIQEVCTDPSCCNSYLYSYYDECERDRRKSPSMVYEYLQFGEPLGVIQMETRTNYPHLKSKLAKIERDKEYASKYLSGDALVWLHPEASSKN